MRTLKRTLCLVLALVMVLGLFGIASATSFPDDSKIQYKEAVDVMTGIGSINGMGDGTFAPTGKVTRAQAAKMVAYAILGADVAKDLPVSASSFKDVDSNYNWAIPSIEYLADKGIVGGRSGRGGNYDPEGEVTAYEVAKMLLCAAGYGKHNEFTGNSWALNVAIVAQKNGVFSGTKAADLNKGATREECALYCFNGLTKVDMVSWSKDKEAYVSAEKGTIAKDVHTLNKIDADNNGVAGYYWVLGTYIKADKSNVVSPWIAKSAVVTVVNPAATGRELYNQFKFKADVTDKDKNVTKYPTLVINGKELASNSGEYDDLEVALAQITPYGTAKPFAGLAGTKLEFVDSDKDGAVDKVFLTIEYLAKVTNIKAATTTSAGTLTYTVYDRTDGISETIADTKDYNLTGIAKDDYVIVVPKGNDSDGFKTPISITKATPKTTTVDSYFAGAAGHPATVTIGGETKYYSYACKLGAGTTYTFAPATYDFYFNSLGFIVGVKSNTTTSALDYVFVHKVQASASNSIINGGYVAKAQVTYMDGKTEVVDYEIKTATTKINDNILAGDKYIVFMEVDGATPHYIELDPDPKAGPIDTSALVGLHSYTKTDKGITLNKQVNVTVGATDYDGKTIATADANIKVTKGSAVVAGATGFFATSATNLVVVDAAGTATTYTGYNNFPSAAGTTYTVKTAPATAGDCKTIVYLTKGNVITDIVVLGAYNPGVTANAILAFTGGSYVAPNDKGVSTSYYQFVGTDGKVVAYPVDNPAALASGVKSIYAASIVDGVATLTQLVDDTDIGTDKDTAAGTVDTVVDGQYIVVGDKPLYTNKTMLVYDLTSTNPTEWTLGTVAKNDTVTVVYSTATATNGQIAYVFVTAHEA